MGGATSVDESAVVFDSQVGPGSEAHSRFRVLADGTFLWGYSGTVALLRSLLIRPGSSYANGDFRHSTFLGYGAGELVDPSQGRNTLVGVNAGRQVARENVAVGSDTLTAYQSNESVAVGNAALMRATGEHNHGVGTQAGYEITTGMRNNVFGMEVMSYLVSGHDNCAIGHYAGCTQQDQTPIYGNESATSGCISGSRNMFLGNWTGILDGTQPDDGVAVGYEAVIGRSKGVAVGSRAQAKHAGSVALGADTETTADGQVAVGARDVEVQSSAHGVVLTSPNGSRFRLTVGDDGTLSTTAL